MANGRIWCAWCNDWALDPEEGGRLPEDEAAPEDESASEEEPEVQEEWTHCPDCGVELRTRRLSGHLAKKCPGSRVEAAPRRARPPPRQRSAARASSESAPGESRPERGGILAGLGGTVILTVFLGFLVAIVSFILPDLFPEEVQVAAWVIVGVPLGLFILWNVFSSVLKYWIVWMSGLAAVGTLIALGVWGWPSDVWTPTSSGIGAAVLFLVLLITGSGFFLGAFMAASEQEEEKGEVMLLANWRFGCAGVAGPIAFLVFLVRYVYLMIA